MIRKVPGTQKRSGATMVEMAAVVSVFLLLLFGIIEYCRFIFHKQVVVNASREGARYAVVHTYDTAVEADTIQHVKNKMTGLEKNLPNYKCLVYWSDASGNKLGIPGDAQYGQYIAVDITGDYDPILPSFLFLNNTIKIQARTLMLSEAN